MNRGKDFEGVFSDCARGVANTQVTRLKDPVGKYKGARNHCDFIMYHYPLEYHLECKSHKGNVFSIHSNNPEKCYGCITNTQWDGLLERSTIEGVVCGVVLWFLDHDITVFIPIQTLKTMRDKGAKSFNVKDIGEECIVITGKKKRVFFEYDVEGFFNECEKRYCNSK